mmetsp:Transcript_21482/g.49343  ORF Transcript_21482/g.49343 Transcript_21482/m.49343 type:complete len:461 (-) Transcript_21482:269-1651(-)
MGKGGAQVSGSSYELIRSQLDQADAGPMQKYGAGIAHDGTRIKEAKRPQLHGTGQPLLVGVRGKWYDVSKYVSRHPGGDLLLEFVGKDATAQFVAYHSDRVLKGWRPVGEYEWNAEAPGGDQLEGDVLRLSARFETEGLFETPRSFVAQRFAITFGFLSAALLCARLAAVHGLLLGFVLGPVALAAFWQQSGFLMHDFMHNHMFHRRKLDQRFGWFFGSVCFGSSSHWWRDEHNEHHLFTNTVIPGVGLSDPQMGETIWAQDPMLFAYFHKLVLPFLLRIQHIIFLPVLIIIGPIGIKIDALVSESRPSEYLGMGLHWAWVAGLISSFPTVAQGLLFYGIASLCVGVLSVQLLVSHYSKPFADKEWVKGEGRWARRQIAAVIDITCQPWMDWFHGGLNLHSPHHLFPRMCRCHYRRVHGEMLALCRKHGLELDVMPWTSAVARTIRHLRTMKTLFSIDPR